MCREIYIIDSVMAHSAPQLQVVWCQVLIVAALLMQSALCSMSLPVKLSRNCKRLALIAQVDLYMLYPLGLAGT